MKKTTRDLKTWSKRNVPEDLWPEILSRLPVKSLLRFRCVSRSWRSFIDDPNFVRLHLTRFNNNRNQSHLFAVQGTSRKPECVVKCSRTLRTTDKLGFLRVHLPGSYILCSIDGLFLLTSNTESDLVLWNPSIRKTLTLPAPPEICNGMKFFNFGLGFDSSIQDYKFVRFVLGSNDGQKGVQFVAIYTVGTNSWKTVEFQGKDCSTWREDFIFDSYTKNYDQTTFCFKGALYALASDGIGASEKLVSFDLSREVFAFIGLPEDPDMYHHDLTLADGGCSLAVVHGSKPKGCVWVLESLGDDIESWVWIPRYTFPTMLPDYKRNVWDVHFVYLKKDGELLLKEKDSVIAYNYKTDEEKTILKKKLHRSKTWAYVESLYCFK